MATGNRFISNYPNALLDTQVQSLSPADAEVIQSPVGRTQWLYEHATGGPGVVNDMPRVPKNAQGLVGHDHSGPPYGSCFKHPLFVWGGALTTGGGWTNYRERVISGSVKRFIFRGHVWVRAFPSYITDTPYSRAYVTVRLSCGAGTENVLVKLRNNNNPEKSETVVATTTETTFELTEYIKIHSGRNYIDVDISSANTSNVFITGVSGHQIVKRTH